MIGKSLRNRGAAILLLNVFLLACSSHTIVGPPPDPSVLLRAIPAADPARYERIHDMKEWRNPYLVIRSDGVALLDSADSTEIHLKFDELLAALARLPASNWPYGRVVAAAENGGRTTEQDGVAIRRSKGIVGGLLAGAQIAVNWVPST